MNESAPKYRKVPYLTVVKDVKPVSANDVIREIVIEATLAPRIEVPARPVNGNDIEKAIRDHLEELVKTYLQDHKGTL